MRIALLGGTGQVGWELRRALAPLGEVAALSRATRGGMCGELENPDGIRRTLRRLHPDVIANAAAWTDVDRAESEPDRAYRINADGVALLAAEAKRLDAWLIHYSTDYVFDGSGTQPWREHDAAAPLNAYGRTKWQGEEAVRETRCRHVILRTQWIYSPRRSNFLRTILRLAAEREALEVVGDQIGAPTGADLIADVTAHIVRSCMTRQAAGTYHLASRGETSWHGYARFVVDGARRAGWPLRLTDGAITSIGSDAFPGGTRRPRNARLSVERLERTFGLRMPEWHLGVARVLAEMGEHRGAAPSGHPAGTKTSLGGKPTDLSV